MAEALLKQAPAEPASLDVLASLNKAASDPLRLDVLRVLRKNSFGVLELCHILDVKQSALSHHLKVLAQAELVNTRREGNSIFYRRQQRPASDPLQPFQQSLFEVLDRQPLSRSLQSRLQHVQKDRAANSRDFFRQQSDSFEQQQERIATQNVYGRAVLDLLDSSGLKSRHTVLEIGPGNGDFLLELAPRFRRVIALDNSEVMLSRARAQVAPVAPTHIDFIHGDTEKAVGEKIRADCVVLNMVLHHVASPADIFQDLYQLVDSDGLLLITELCHHQQDWVKQACGDLWQGFDPEELLHWARDAGFEAQQSVYHALRNGFQIQIHSFRKKNPSH